ncbi:hypothetical protein FPCIR_8358 [Fusarium pseudocircinatum]|uniref:Uncharacterized protein n=1 Tax=Fusarium pseudocircinatum TaxID=56676 RepID=A0A8H5P228_9HYPO|nr:hypothetical protein FPCIR_8358 [Fusarium pseudocircinatum]
MDTSMSAGWAGSEGNPVAIEVQGQEFFHVALTKLQKYPQLYRKINSQAAPWYLYGHISNGMSYPYCYGPYYYINLHKLPQDAGHKLWEYLSFGAFTRLQGNASEKSQEWYFKSIFHLYNLANHFGMEDLKSDSAKEIFRKAQYMGLMELINLLEELNYQSDLFPSLSVYLEKRLVGSTLDYCQGGSQRAFAELQARPSLSVAQMLLKALIEISEAGCKLDEQNSMLGEVYRRKVAETTAASDILGWEEPKVPDTMWMNPKGEIQGVRKSVGSRPLGVAAKQATRREKSNSPEPPFERAAAPKRTFNLPSETEALIFTILPPALASSIRSNEPVLRPPSRDTSTTSSHRSIPYTRGVTRPEIQVDRITKAVGHPELKIHRHRMPHAASQDLPQMKHAASSERPVPGPSATSGQPLSETATGSDDDTEDEATEACDGPVTPTESERSVPENTTTSFDAPWRSSTSSSDTLEGNPVQVEGPMDWDAGLSEYDYDF